MNVNFEYSKTLTGEGSLLLLLSLVPYAGPILGIIGVILFLRGMKEIANYYQDKELYQNALTGVKYYIVAIVAAGVAIAAITIGVASATGFTFTNSFVLTVGFGVGLIASIVGLGVAFVFYILAALHLRKTFNTLAQKSGEASFTTAGSLLMWGSILTIIGVGLILIFIAWIFATIAFFAMKPQQQQPYNPQQNTYTPPSSQPEQRKMTENNGTNSVNHA
jgi:uncharacterized membrane protein